jgi:N-acetylneuraminic acid mutarotase
MIAYAKKLFLSSLVLFVLLSFLFFRPLDASSAEIKEDSWTAKAPLPDGVSTVKAVVVMGKIFAITGSSIYEYDPDADNWTAKTRIPTPRPSASFGVAACQNKIYVIGGGGEYNRSVGYSNLLSTNEVYDPSTDTWETKEPMPTSRDWIEANPVDGKIYVTSGRTHITVNSVIYHHVRTNVTEVYDPATDSWTTKQPIPYPVIKGASAVVDSKIYIMGGLFELNNPLNARYNQIYNTETDTWSLGTPLPTPMWYTAAGATTGTLAPKRIYVMGGGLDELFNVVNVYDPESDSWSSGTPLPTVRTSHAIAVVDDLLYVMGGADGWYGGPVLSFSGGWNLTSKVDQYTPIGYIPEFPSWTPLLITLVAVVAVIVIYRRRLHKQNQRGVKQ